jgi:formyl-CoA transferase
MAAGNDKLWTSVCGVTGRGDLLQDPRFRSTAERALNQEPLRVLLEESFTCRTVGQWLAAFREAGVPCAPINDYAEALADPQVEAMGWVQELELPSGAKARTFGNPIRMDGAAIPIGRRPPALGEHNDEVLAAADETWRTGS